MTSLVSQQVAIETKDAPSAVSVHTAEAALSAPLMAAPKTNAPASRVPDMLKRIAFCESGGRQFDDHGRVIRGVYNPADIGRYQINLTVWGAEAKRLGYDLFSEEGNEAMALELYKRYGTTPWAYSSQCWNTSTLVEASPNKTQK